MANIITETFVKGVDLVTVRLIGRSAANGITSIESMYAPEFSGHTRGIKVEIKE